MKSMGQWLFISALFAACGLAAWFLAAQSEMSFQTALLVAMIAVYVLVSGFLELFRYRLKKQVEKMAAEERAVFSERDLEIRYALPAPGSASPRTTILIGAIAVNGPLIPLMIGPLALLQYIFDIHDPLASVLSLVFGFILAWSWWSVGVSLWRWWATTCRGMPTGEVQWRGEGASLLWPKNHLFEKTELGHWLSKRREP
jgi:hypothetical protein